MRYIRFVLLAILVMPVVILAAEQQQESKLVIGAYYQSAKTDKAYVTFVAKCLKANHFNAVVANSAFTEEMVDTFGQHGISVISKNGALLESATVTATTVGPDPLPERTANLDIPKLESEYKTIAVKTDKPVMVCFKGDGIGTDYANAPWGFWKAVKPKIRCISWYGLQKGHYGILHRRLYAKQLGFSDVLRFSGASRGSWVVLQAFGSDKQNADYHNPSPAEISGMMHLAVAYGARGLLFWTLQNYGNWQCLVDADSLKATDGKLGAAASVAKCLTDNMDLIMAMKPAGGDVRCPDTNVDAVGQVIEGGRQLIYVINKNHKLPGTTKLLWWGEVRPRLIKVTDVFSNKELKILPELDKEGYQVVPLQIAPGQGMLLDWVCAKKEAVAAKPAKRIQAKKKPVKHKRVEPKLADDIPLVRKNGPQRNRKLLEPWLGKGAQWSEPLLGGSLYIDGKLAYAKGGRIVGAYETTMGAFAAWDVTKSVKSRVKVEKAYITSGVLEKPLSLAAVFVDIVPADGLEHQYELRLPVADSLMVKRSIFANLPESAFESAAGTNKIRMRYIKYFEHYKERKPNYVADTVLAPIGKGRSGWLVARLLEPWNGSDSPGEYRKSDSSLVFSATGAELHLKLVLFVSRELYHLEPHYYTTWTDWKKKDELKLSPGNCFVKFKHLGPYRTALKFLSSAGEFAVGYDDEKSAADKMEKELLEGL